MDQELLSHLDQRLGELSRQIAETLDRQMVGLRQETKGEMTALRQEMKGEMTALRQEMKGEIASLRQEVNERLARVEDRVHLTQVTVEAMRGDIQLLAEGFMGQEEKHQTFRAEVNSRLDDIRGTIVPYYADLGQRVVRLEERAARQNQNAIDLIRERFGKASKAQ